MSAVSLLPLSGLLSAMDYRVAGRPEPSTDEIPQAHYRIVMPGYFDSRSDNTSRSVVPSAPTLASPSACLRRIVGSFTVMDIGLEPLLYSGRAGTPQNCS